jgi:hypothetical protein
MRVGLSPIKTSPGTVDAARGYGHPEVSRMPQPSYRAVILRRLDQLGYANYNAYIASPHWRQTRQRYRDSDLPQNCYCCDEEKVELHHTTYERLGQELLTDLKPLCHACSTLPALGSIASNGGRVSSASKPKTRRTRYRCSMSAPATKLTSVFAELRRLPELAALSCVARSAG